MKRKWLAGKKLRSFRRAFARRQPYLEVLEKRAVLAAFTPGNLVVSSSPFEDTAKLIEFQPDGTFVQRMTMPQTSSPASEKGRDLILDRMGNAQVFNGTYDTRLTTLDPVTGNFSHATFPFWNTSGVPTYGGVAALNAFVYVTDQRLPTETTSSQGIVRFNVENLSSGWSKDFNPDIGDTQFNTSLSIPHITIHGRGDDTRDYYSVTVATPNSRGVFDIDRGLNIAGNPLTTSLRLFDQTGTLLRENNGDVPITHGSQGSSNRGDAYLEYTFAAAGSYVIEVGTCCSNGAMPVGATYDLQLSIENHSLYFPGSVASMNEDARDFNNTLETAQSTDNAERFAQGRGDPIDLAMGLDGKLYALISAGSSTLGGTQIDVYDPVSMQRLRQVTLPQEARAIAVDQAGHIYAVDPDIRHYTPNGEFVALLSNQNVGGFLSDIDIDDQGRVFVSSNNGNIITTNLALDDVDFFLARPSNGYTFITIVRPPMSFPLAANDTYRVEEDSTQNLFNVLFNDVGDPRGQLTVEGVSNTALGATVAISGSKSIHYTPPANAFGTDTFTYTVNDGLGNRATATITVTVSNVNEDPTADADGATVNEDSTNTQIDVLANDGFAPDINETLNVLSAGNATQGGTVSVTPDGMKVTYSPKPNFFGVEHFTYTVGDGNGGTAVGTVTMTVNPLNDSPTIGDDARCVITGSTNVPLDVMVNDSSAPDATETLTITAVGTPNNGGTVAITGGTSLTYSPAAGFSGFETLTYTVSDGILSSTATVTVEVGICNNPPTLVNDVINVRYNSRNNQLFVLRNDTTLPDTGETLTITNVSPPTGTGTVSIDPDGSTLRYSPQIDLLNSTDSFIYTARDSRGASSTAQVSINIGEFNGLPTANPDTYIVKQNSTGNTLTVLTNDTDPDDGEVLIIDVITGNPRGTVTISADGKRLNYNAPSPFLGTDTFTYEILDSRGGRASAEVRVGVRGWQNPVNRFDVSNDGLPQPIPEDVLVIINQLNTPVGHVDRIMDAFGKLPDAPENPAYFYDVNGDGYLTAIDALLPINAINSGTAGEGDGEGEFVASLDSHGEGEGSDDSLATTSSSSAVSTVTSKSANATPTVLAGMIPEALMGSRITSRKRATATNWGSLLEVLARDVTR